MGCVISFQDISELFGKHRALLLPLPAALLEEFLPSKVWSDPLGEAVLCEGRQTPGTPVCGNQSLSTDQLGVKKAEYNSLGVKKAEFTFSLLPGVPWNVLVLGQHSRCSRVRENQGQPPFAHGR